MSIDNSKVIENVRVVMLKGEKGDQSPYDDLEIREMIRTQDAKISDLTDIVNSFDGLSIFKDFTPYYEIGEEATCEYHVGDYIVWQSKLYKVIDEIAIYDELIENENIELTTVVTEFNRVESNIDNEFKRVAKEIFLLFNQINSKNTIITKGLDGTIANIVETSSDAISTTNVVTVSDVTGTRTTITKTIVPTEGEQQYVKITIIEEIGDTISVTETYTIENKEVEQDG